MSGIIDWEDKVKMCTALNKDDMSAAFSVIENKDLDSQATDMLLNGISIHEDKIKSNGAIYKQIFSKINEEFIKELSFRCAIRYEALKLRLEELSITNSGS